MVRDKGCCQSGGTGILVKMLTSICRRTVFVVVEALNRRSSLFNEHNLENGD